MNRTDPTPGITASAILVVAVGVTLVTVVVASLWGLSEMSSWALHAMAARG